MVTPMLAVLLELPIRKPRAFALADRVGADFIQAAEDEGVAILVGDVVIENFGV